MRMDVATSFLLRKDSRRISNQGRWRCHLDVSESRSEIGEGSLGLSCHHTEPTDVSQATPGHWGGGAPPATPPLCPGPRVPGPSGRAPMRVPGRAHRGLGVPFALSGTGQESTARVRPPQGMLGRRPVLISKRTWGTVALFSVRGGGWGLVKFPLPQTLGYQWQAHQDQETEGTGSQINHRHLISIMRQKNGASPRGCAQTCSCLTRWASHRCGPCASVRLGAPRARDNGEGHALGPTEAKSFVPCVEPPSSSPAQQASVLVKRCTVTISDRSKGMTPHCRPAPRSLRAVVACVELVPGAQLEQGRMGEQPSLLTEAHVGFDLAGAGGTLISSCWALCVLLRPSPHLLRPLPRSGKRAFAQVLGGADEGVSKQRGRYQPRFPWRGTGRKDGWMGGRWVPQRRIGR